ncbi:MAG: amino-acid N-acetyltransferase [Treponema sp.]|nr:amino-acid N-acetyltransferase [Treponema sp.]
MSTRDRAASIRDVIRYIDRFRDALLVIYLDGKLLDQGVFLSHIKDIALLHRAGLRIIIVPGAADRIDAVLSGSQIKWRVHDGCRVTDAEAMPLIKMAAFDVSNQVMTALAGEKVPALIGNWVRARGRGVLAGFDWGTVGDIDRVDAASLGKVLEDGFIPIFPCIGWSLAGKPYNISSMLLAEKIASHLNADKLFYLVPDVRITSESYTIPEGLGLSDDGTVPALSLDELDSFIALNFPSDDSRTSERTVNMQNGKAGDKIAELLTIARRACSSGVARVHLLDGSMEGTLPCEIFSDFGSGTMVYVRDYGRIRDMESDDIPAVLTLMQPFVDKGILLPRSKQSLQDQLSHYIVYELDGAIRACAALVPYSDGQMEIAGIAVEKSCSSLGIGQKLVEFLIKRAKKSKAAGVFLLTTQTSDWFEGMGFKLSSLSSIPEQRKAIWTPERGSVVYRLEG